MYFHCIVNIRHFCLIFCNAYVLDALCALAFHLCTHMRAANLLG
jgi:hypothetical protein